MNNPGNAPVSHAVFSSPSSSRTSTRWPSVSAGDVDVVEIHTSGDLMSRLSMSSVLHRKVPFRLKTTTRSLPVSATARCELERATSVGDRNRLPDSFTPSKVWTSSPSGLKNRTTWFPLSAMAITPTSLASIPCGWCRMPGSIQGRLVFSFRLIMETAWSCCSVTSMRPSGRKAARGRAKFIDRGMPRPDDSIGPRFRPGSPGPA